MFLAADRAPAQAGRGPNSTLAATLRAAGAAPDAHQAGPYAMRRQHRACDTSRTPARQSRSC